MRAYRKARAWLIATPAAEVAKAEASFFKDIDLAVLTADDRHLPEARQLDAARGDHQAGLRGHRSTSSSTPGLITKRHAYEDVVAPPPA